MDKAHFPRLTNSDFHIGGQSNGFLPSYNSDTSWPPFPDACDDFVPRDSLGILKAHQLANDSLIDQSARESLGILNLSEMDIGRDSIGLLIENNPMALFSINNPIFHKQFKLAEKTSTMTSLNDVNSSPSPFTTFIETTTAARSSAASTFTSSLNPFNDGFLCDSLNTTHSINNKSQNARPAFLRAIDNNSGHCTFIKNESRIASDTNELDDSLFDPDTFGSKDYFLNEAKYNLDLTAQPEWPECDLTPTDDELGTNITVCKPGNVAIQTGGSSDNLGVSSDDKVSNSSANIGRNISNISQASTGPSNSLELPSQDHSILQHISILSELIGTKENLSQHQKTEGQRHLRQLADLFRDDEKKKADSEKSLHPSTQNAKQEKRKSNENLFLATATGTSSSSTSARPPNNLSSQCKAIPGANQFNKLKASAPLKREPLRAILPVENMSKTKMIKKLNNSSTPEQKIGESKNVLNKSSSSCQESKLKPLASSTPDSRLGNFSRSFTSSNISAVASDKTPTRKPLPKLDGAVLMRRNSERVADRKKDVQKPKRSRSTGRESKLSIALSKVRKNMLNSPHLSAVLPGFNSQGIIKPTNLVSKYSSKFAGNKTAGKENMQPVTARPSK